MDVPFPFPLTIAIDYVVALLAFPCLRASRWTSVFLAVCFGIVLLVSPLLIPADKIVMRALACVIGTDLTFKLVDYGRNWATQHHERMKFAEYCRFLIPFPALLVTFRQWRRSHRRPLVNSLEIIRASIGLVVFGAICVSRKTVDLIPAVQVSVVIEHLIKLVLFVIAIESLSIGLTGLERMLGFQTPPIIRFAFVSRTVGEFWQRYNTRVHNWFVANIFSPAGGRHAPLSGMWLTFLFSAVHHELAFGIATSTIDGCQFAFFILQAPAAMVSHWLDHVVMRWGPIGRVISHLATVIWFATCSPLFFRGVDRVFGIYLAR